MSPDALIRRAATQGVALYVQDGVVRIRSKRQPPDDLRQELRRHRDAILDHLAARASGGLDQGHPQVDSLPTTSAPTSSLEDQWKAVAAHLGELVKSTAEDETADARVRYWRQRLDLMPMPADRKLAEATRECRRCLFEPWLRQAVQFGWSEAELWGVPYGWPRSNAGMGLVPSLVLTSLRKPLTVVEVTADQAIITTASGSRVRHSSTGTFGPPIWT